MLPQRDMSTDYPDRSRITEFAGQAPTVFAGRVSGKGLGAKPSENVGLGQSPHKPNSFTYLMDSTAQNVENIF